MYKYKLLILKNIKDDLKKIRKISFLNTINNSIIFLLNLKKFYNIKFINNSLFFFFISKNL